MAITHITKREGTIQPFNPKKITQAIFSAMRAVKHGTRKDAEKISLHVEKLLGKIYKGDTYPTVENIQDVVEEALMFSDFYDVAKAYILYREKRSQERKRYLFKKRTNLKPYEYPELAEYVMPSATPTGFILSLTTPVTFRTLKSMSTR